MRIVQQGETVNISEIEDLAASNSAGFQSELGPVLDAGVSEVELDFARTRFVDCGGVGALAAVRKAARRKNPAVTFRLVNAPPALQRLLKVTRMDQVFPLESPEAAAPPAHALAVKLMPSLTA